MDAERWQQVTALFAEAVGLSAEEREALLAARASDDRELVGLVRGLLDADRSAGAFLAAPAEPPGEAAADGAATIGRYQLLEPIGRGGFGEVYRGFDPVLQRSVAIKVCADPSEAARRRFVREAALAARLVHPHVVAVHDFGTDGGLAYLVQELLPGEDLAAVLARGERWPLEVAVDFLRGVAQGLAYAHAQGVVHRDVKPSNLRVLPDGRVKILDFGIARDVAATTAVTGTGELVGTLGYLAPERLFDDAAAFPADVWSFGRVAAELLAERPRPLVELLDRCLAVDPAARPTAAELATALDSLAGRPAREKTRPWRRRLLAAGGLAAVAIAGALLVAPRGSPPPAVSASGRLLIDARPWGELVTLTALGSRLILPLPADPTTPLALTLPPGDYEAVLRHPRAARVGRCRARVAPGVDVRCRVVLVDLEPEALFAGGT